MNDLVKALYLIVYNGLDAPIHIPIRKNIPNRDNDYRPTLRQAKALVERYLASRAVIEGWDSYPEVNESQIKVYGEWPICTLMRWDSDLNAWVSWDKQVTHVPPD